jgi:hypothetical protein
MIPAATTIKQTNERFAIGISVFVSANSTLSSGLACYTARAIGTTFRAGRLLQHIG